MNKLFSFVTLLILAWGTTNCSDSNTEEHQAILISQEALSLSLGANCHLTHTISFETTGQWQASVQKKSDDAWISVTPESGSAGKNEITVTATENTEESPRKTFILILCGDKSVSISVTQEPDTEEPAKPEHPEVTPENLLTYIEVTQTIDKIPEEETCIRKSYIHLTYDDQGKPVNIDRYSLDTQQPDKIDGTEKISIKRASDKFTTTADHFEIYCDGAFLLPKRETLTTEYKLNDSGLISAFNNPSESTTIEYNPDGTVAHIASKYPTINRINELTYKWLDDNIAFIYQIGNTHYRYTYTEYPNPWHGIDIGSLLTGQESYETVMLLGISGTTTKNLPATRENEKFDSSQYEYTFDAKGRVRTIEIHTIWQGIGNGHTEYKLHYGTQTIPQYDYLPYLIKQEVIEEGTLDYSFIPDHPETHFVYPNSYNSYIKILSTFTDGSTREDTTYGQCALIANEKSAQLPENICISQADFDEFKLVSKSIEKKGESPEIRYYTYTLEYTGFCIELECMSIEPNSTFRVYSDKSGKMEYYPMPVRTIDENCLVLYDPTFEKIEENDLGTSYLFTQKYLLQVNPAATPTEEDINQISGNLFVLKE